MKRLGDILIESGLLTREQVDRAVIIAEANQQRLGEALIESRLLSEAQIARALAAQLELELIDLRTTSIPSEILTVLPADVAKEYRVVPIRLERDRLIVATADPTNVQTEDALRAATGHDIGFAVAIASDIRRALEQATTPKLGTILVQSRKISPQQLEEALEEVQATGRRLGEVLIARGLVSEADIAQAMRAQSRKLGSILVNAGLLTDDQLERALIIAKASRKRLGEVLVEIGLLPEMAIAHALAEQSGLKTIDLKSAAIPAHVIGLLPRHVAAEFGIIPVDINGSRLIIATADPTNVGVEDYLRNTTNLDITFVVAPPTDIAWALEKYYPTRLTAVMDQLAQAGLIPPTSVPQVEGTDQTPPPHPQRHRRGGQAVETIIDVVVPPSRNGKGQPRLLSIRTEIWLLAVLVTSLTLAPWAISSLIRGRLHPLNREAALIQAAVDAYRTDASVQTSPGSASPHRFPTDRTTYQPGEDLLISMPVLSRAGYLSSIPASASPVNGGTEGHYIWVIESDTGRVKACHQATLAGTAVLDCIEGYDGRYP